MLAAGAAHVQHAPKGAVIAQVFSEQERLEQIQKLLLRKIDEAREGDQQETS